MLPLLNIEVIDGKSGASEFSARLELSERVLKEESAPIKLVIDTVGKGKSGLFLTLKSTKVEVLKAAFNKFFESVTDILQEQGLIDQGVSSKDVFKLQASADVVVVSVSCESLEVLAMVGEQIEAVVGMCHANGIDGSLRLATDMRLRDVIGKVTPNKPGVKIGCCQE